MTKSVYHLALREEDFKKDTAELYLAYFRSNHPTQKLLCDMKQLLFNVWLQRDMLFSPNLNKRQRQCLYHAAHGKNTKEIARLLKISIGTAENYCKEVLENLACKNMKQAVAVGIRYGKSNGKKDC